jgi:hypothetical protein
MVYMTLDLEYLPDSPGATAHIVLQHRDRWSKMVRLSVKNPYTGYVCSLTVYEVTSSDGPTDVWFTSCPELERYMDQAYSDQDFVEAYWEWAKLCTTP